MWPFLKMEPSVRNVSSTRWSGQVLGDMSEFLREETGETMTMGTSESHVDEKKSENHDPVEVMDEADTEMLTPGQDSWKAPKVHLPYPTSGDGGGPNLQCQSVGLRVWLRSSKLRRRWKLRRSYASGVVPVVRRARAVRPFVAICIWVGMWLYIGKLGGAGFDRRSQWPSLLVPCTWPKAGGAKLSVRVGRANDLRADMSLLEQWGWKVLRMFNPESPNWEFFRANPGTVTYEVAKQCCMNAAALGSPGAWKNGPLNGKIVKSEYSPCWQSKCSCALTWVFLSSGVEKFFGCSTLSPQNFFWESFFRANPGTVTYEVARQCCMNAAALGSPGAWKNGPLMASQERVSPAPSKSRPPS